MSKKSSDGLKSIMDKIAEEYYQLLNEPMEGGITTDELFYRCQRFGFNLDRPTLNRLQAAKVVTPQVNKFGKVNYYSYISLLEIYVFYLVSTYIPGYGNNSKIRDKLLYFSAARDFTMYLLGVDFKSITSKDYDKKISSFKSFLENDVFKNPKGFISAENFIRLVNAMDISLVHSLERSNVTSRINIENSPFSEEKNVFFDLQSRNELSLYELKRLTTAYFFFTYIFLCFAKTDLGNLQHDNNEIEKLFDFYKSFDNNTNMDILPQEASTSGKKSSSSEISLLKIKSRIFSDNRTFFLESLDDIEDEIPVISRILELLKHNIQSINAWLDIFYNYTEPFSLFEYIVFNIFSRKMKDNLNSSNQFEPYQLRMALELLLMRSSCFCKMDQYPELKKPTREGLRKRNNNHQNSQSQLSLQEMLPIVTAYIQGKITKAQAAKMLGVSEDEIRIDLYKKNDDFPFM